MEAYTPLWVLAFVASIGAMCGAGYGIAKLYYFVLDRRLAYRQKLSEVTRQDDSTDRRTAAQEAWEVVDRLTAELEAVTPRIKEIQTACEQIKKDSDDRERTSAKRAAKCEADHAGTKRVLKIVVAWGKQKGMKLPPDLEKEINEMDGDEEDKSRPSVEE
jgi:hypothetical protein